ncbi:MAG: AAA family ATPase, partial [Streptosporangiaceae bacterium]
MTPWVAPPLPARLAAVRRAPLVGRRLEPETMEAVWSEVTGGRRQVVFAGGEPGAGRTRLIAEIAGALHDNDVSVLAGACGLDAGVSYQPFAEMLDHLFGAAAEGALAGVVAGRGSELQRLSLPVGRHCREPAGPTTGPGGVRRDLFDAVAHVFRALAEIRAAGLDARRPALGPAADDCHARHVVQTCPESPVVVVAAFRSTVADRSDELAARVAELHRLEGVRRLDLSGLDTEAIAVFLTLRAGLPR